MYTLTGTVIDHITQLPIEQASVMLNYLEGDSTDIAQITNEDGEFKWTHLTPGNYELQVYCDGYESQIKQLTLSDVKDYVFKVKLHKE